MSGNNISDGKLLITAVTAALAGAGIAYAMTKSSDKRGTPTYTRDPHTTEKTAFIFDDPSNTEAIRALGHTNDTKVLLPHNHEEKMRRRIAHRVSVEEENSTSRRSVTVKVPGTSANIGPGYDCLGMAVDLWTEVTVTRAEKFEIIATGEGADSMPLDE
eukprot:CAMPEP_0195537240 /NCGR_PEP_ID=MMETSP0794_2-20130614/47588_1 /TAXON_ID=515487 /ORGANISM="Stephanopyxis turris, Strain CCMP 815" /LENGTH=158 /DNA_ID=CAMNT_0040670907 /DNA_START=57 /DNA_END=530 /DNA_ORIENTATION=-